MAGRTTTKVTVLDHGATVPKFDYGQLPATAREALREHARGIRERLVFTALAMIDIGEHLVAARPLLPHGAWLPWLVAETGMSESWSRDCIRVFERFHERRQVVEEKIFALPATAFVRLAAAPAEATEDVFGRVQEGERLRVTDVEQVIREYRQRKGELDEGKGPHATAHKESELGCIDVLHALADRARDELIPQILARAQGLAQRLHEADETLRSGKRVTAKDLRPLFRDAQWLTDALEQLTQRRGAGSGRVVHQTFLDRPPHDGGPWGDVAAFLRAIGSSDAIDAELRGGISAFVKRGLDAFNRAL